MREQWWLWKTVSTRCSYSKEVNTSSPPKQARAVVAMDNGKHVVLVLEIGQNLFIVNQARTVVAMEKRS
jgi:hypothetical protein